MSLIRRVWCFKGSQGQDSWVASVDFFVVPFWLGFLSYLAWLTGFRMEVVTVTGPFVNMVF